uniref:Uncharacterized protein n=1 Tax=Monopterus albus TaxID=43700 RepID=A0A3Q3JBD7_MONAL
MASTGNLSEEQVHCSICLDVFTNPVSIPCGHNFCQSCIVGYWKTSSLYQCPMCKKTFHKRPDISVNTVLREIAEQFKEIRIRGVEGKVKDEERQTERRAGGLITELEQEIAELRRRNTGLENVAQTDHIHFLKKFPALSTPPSVKDWSNTSVPTDMCVGMIRRSVSKLEQNKSFAVFVIYAVDVTLDPDTANPWLQLSQDRRQVRHLGAWQDLPDHPDRFDTVVIVLGREGFTSGRHYWEVQVGEKDDWYLGVAKSSVNRKGRISVSTTQGYWALARKKGQGYRVSTSPPLLLPLDPKLKQIGVYVDYDEGQVSFYDIRAQTHIYTLKDTFTEKILPFFYLYCCDKSSDTIMICPVNGKSLTKQS